MDWGIFGKFVLLVIGFVFFFILLNHRDDEDLYGSGSFKTRPIQLLVLLGLLLFLICCLLLDMFLIFEDFIRELPDDLIGIYFPAMVSVVVAIPLVIVGKVISILYGSLFIEYQGNEMELKKIKSQTKIWIVFAVYSSAVVFVLFILLPLMNRIGH